MVGERLSFSGADSTDPDGRIVSYAWDFGDGTTGSGVNVTHSYKAAGTYKVTLTVTDDGKGTAQVSSPREVSAASNTYTVQSGDTLMGISRKLFNGDPQYWDEIADLNDIKAPYTIYPGQELKVPKKGTETTPVSAQPQTPTTSKTYTVQSGDCLMDIARKRLGDPHRWREIANLNGIGPPYTIYPGDKLKLPE